jgi:uncharacterized protein
MFFCTDTVALDGGRVTRDGYLVADARTARTGLQTYQGREVGKPEKASIVVYRPEDEVFKADALASMAHRPVTINHPAAMVTADNWKTHARGMTGGEVARDGDFVRIPLTVMDADAIRDVQAGKRQLSWGYTCDLDWTPGVTADGKAYDAIQRNIRGNHLAIVDAARAGPACRIGDAFPCPEPEGGRPVTEKNLKTITVDGIPVEVTDAASAVITKLQTAIADADKARGEALASVQAKDGEIAALKAKLADAEMTPAKLDAAVAERAAVVDAARKIVPTLDAAGKTLAAIKREAVVAKMADAKDMSDAGIEGAFKVLASGSVSKDPIRTVTRDGGVTVTDAFSDRDKAFTDHLAHLSTAWNGQTTKEA